MASNKDNIIFTKTSFLQGGNSPFIKELYLKYLDDPKSIPQSWIDFFNGRGVDQETIKKEILDSAKNTDTPLKNAPHTALEIASENWNKSYTREVAAYPTKHQKKHKYWPPVGRIDNAYGDRNLVCTCPSVDDYKK